MKRYSEEEVRDLVSRTARLRNADVAELEKQEEYLNTQVKLLEEISAGLEEVIDSCQKESTKLLDRIDQLEQLCRDLWLFACITGSGGAEKAFEQRMNALGLLEGEQE